MCEGGCRGRLCAVPSPPAGFLDGAVFVQATGSRGGLRSKRIAASLSTWESCSLMQSDAVRCTLGACPKRKPPGWAALYCFAKSRMRLLIAHTSCSVIAFVSRSILERITRKLRSILDADIFWILLVDFEGRSKSKDACFSSFIFIFISFRTFLY